MSQPASRKLTRSNDHRMIFGVCGGLSEYFGVDPLIFRVFFLALAFGAGSGVLLYLMLTLLIPSESEADGQGESVIQARVQEVAGELKHRVSTDNRKGWIGMIVIVIGVMILFDRVIPWRFFDWGVFWAIMVMVVGFMLLSSKASSSDSKSSNSDGMKVSTPPGVEAESVLPNPQQTVPHSAYPEEQKPPERRRSPGGLGSFLFGIVVVVLGFGLLAQNIGFVPNIDFGFLFRLWPIFIIIVGLSLLSRGTWVGRFISVILTLVLVAAIALLFIIPEPAGTPVETPFMFSIDNQVKRLKVNIDTGASSTMVRSSSDPVITGSFTSNVTRLEAKDHFTNGVQTVDLTTTQGNILGFRGKFVNGLNVALPKHVPVDLNIDSGASKLDVNLTDLMTENVGIDTGASQLTLTLGSASQRAFVRINAGASSITVNTNRESGVKLVVDTGLSGKRFSGFTQIDDQTYQTENYETASSTIDIRIDAGVSNIVVNRI